MAVAKDPILAAVGEWQRANAALAKAKDAELRLRLALAVLFKSPKEGTNTLELVDGSTLKLDHRLNYKLDAEALPVVLKALKKQGVEIEELFRWKPELAMKVYRTLTPEQLLTLSDALSVEPGTPGLSHIPKQDKKESGSAKAATRGVRSKGAAKHK